MFKDVASPHETAREAGEPNSISNGGLGEAIFRQLVNDLPAAVYMCDAEGRISLFNDAAVKLWGRTPELGKDLWCGSYRAFRPDGSPLPLDQCPMALTLKEGRPVRGVEIIVERPDGTRRHVLPYPSPLRDSQGRVIGAMNMVVDITDRIQQDTVKSESEVAQARLGAIIESSDDAIISKTLGGIITSWNRSAELLFGHTAEQAIGQSIFLIIPPDRREEEMDIMRRLKRGERIDHFETKRLRRDGQLVDISLTISPVRNSHGVIIGASKIARDIAARKQWEGERERLLEAERHARSESQRVNRMKDEFLATLSHELRTPLNAVMGWAQLLAGGLISPGEMREAGQVIERNARTQKQLIDDLLDMSRIISGKLRLDMHRIEPITFVEAAMEIVQPLANSKGITLERDLDSTAGPINADGSRMQQVVWNLLTNAMKFTPREGRVRVGLHRAGSQVELSVSDTGQGIKPEFLPRLFERFSQADASANRKHGGLGLGLAIVKQLTELHGGTISAESAGEGKGATFTIHLPVPVLKSEMIGTSPARHGNGEHDVPDLSGLRVLVVDDEPDARELIRRLLDESGAIAVSAGSADEGLKSMESEQFNLVVSDIGMPRVDGYEFLRRMRQSGAPSAKMPAIALTAFARSEDRTRALRAGYIAHVAKPVEPSELLATIAVVAGRMG